MRVLACLALLLTVLAGVAHADATPTQVVLVYTPSVSTTNTPSATGIAELVLQEGEVRISVTDLPHLDGDGQYVAWVLDTESNAYLRLGAFNTAQSTGAAHFETVLPETAPTNRHWNLVLLTIENTPTPDHPGRAHSIAGVFPAPGSDVLPVMLPNTGGADNDELPAVSHQRGGANWLLNPVVASLLLLVGGGAGYALGKRSAKC
jgi:hypothetical protein